MDVVGLKGRWANQRTARIYVNTSLQNIATHSITPETENKMSPARDLLHQAMTKIAQSSQAWLLSFSRKPSEREAYPNTERVMRTTYQINSNFGTSFLPHCFGRQSKLATDPSCPVVAVRGIDGEKGFTTGGCCGGEGPATRTSHLLDALAMQATQGRRLTVGAVAHAPRPFLTAPLLQRRLTVGAVAHAPRPFRAASFLRRRLTVGAVAQAPRPHAPGLRYAQERAIQLALGFSAALTLQAKPELRNSSLLHGWAPSGIK